MSAACWARSVQGVQRRHLGRWLTSCPWDTPPAVLGFGRGAPPRNERARERRIVRELTTINRSVLRRTSAVGDHDLAKVATALEMTIGLLCFGESECPVDHGAQAVHRDRSVHGLEIGAAPDAD